MCVCSMFTFRCFWTCVCACVRNKKRRTISDNGKKNQANGRKMRVRSCSLKDRMRVTEWHLHLCPKSERCVSKRGPFGRYSDFRPIFKVKFGCSRFQHPLRSATPSPANSKHRTWSVRHTVLCGLGQGFAQKLWTCKYGAQKKKKKSGRKCIDRV